MILSAIDHVQDPLDSIYVLVRKTNGLCSFRCIYIYIYMVESYCEREQEMTSVGGIGRCVGLVVCLHSRRMPLDRTII